MYSRYSSDSEAKGSELLENIEKVFPGENSRFVTTHAWCVKRSFRTPKWNSVHDRI